MLRRLERGARWNRLAYQRPHARVLDRADEGTEISYRNQVPLAVVRVERAGVRAGDPRPSPTPSARG